MRGILIALIKAYKYFISPALGNNCRFYPTCSTYSIDAIKQHGVAVGFYLTVRRLSKCHPFHPGGMDPVPEHIGKK